MISQVSPLKPHSRLTLKNSALTSGFLPNASLYFSLCSLSPSRPHLAAPPSAAVLPVIPAFADHRSALSCPHTCGDRLTLECMLAAQPPGALSMQAGAEEETGAQSGASRQTRVFKKEAEAFFSA